MNSIPLTDRQKTIIELGKDNPIIHNVLTAQKIYRWSWERTLEQLVIVLANHSEEMQEHLTNVLKLVPTTIVVEKNNVLLDKLK